MTQVKLSSNFPAGTSFHSDTIKTTVNTLRRVIGEPQINDNGMREKCNYDWFCETADGTFFTVYDWKEYRPLRDDEQITFHIGAYSKEDSRKAHAALKQALSQ